MSNTPTKEGMGAKAPLSLIYPKFLEEMARVLKGGEEKYGPQNWMNKSGLPWEALSDSTMRHILEFTSGARIDKDSGLHPLVHAACNCMMLYYYDTHRTKYGVQDNRRFMDCPPQATVDELQNEVTSWANSVFPDRTMSEMLTKLKEEIQELEKSECLDPLEYGDVAIMLLDMATVGRASITEAVRQKMEINRRRTWMRREDGTRQHVEEK